METQEQNAAGTAPAQGTKPTAEQQFQQVIGRLGQLTISLTQQRDELAERERQAEALAADITQRRLRLVADERECLRAQGAAEALQVLVKGEGATDA